MLSAFRTLCYRFKYQFLLRRATFASGVSVRCRLVIHGPGKVALGRCVVIGPDRWGHDIVTLFTHSPQARIKVGDGARLLATRVGCRGSIEFGTGSTVESASIFDNDFHNTDAESRDDPDAIPVGPVTIGPDAYVGLEALCGKGTQLGNGAKLLAGTVISTKRVPEGKTLMGNPARPVR